MWHYACAYVQKRKGELYSIGNFSDISKKKAIKILYCMCIVITNLIGYWVIDRRNLYMLLGF